MKVLVVEDNARLGMFVAEALRQSGFTIERVGLAKDAERALAAGRYDAIVLDLGKGRIGAVSYNSSAPPSARSRRAKSISSSTSIPRSLRR